MDHFEHENELIEISSLLVLVCQSLNHMLMSKPPDM